MSDDVSELMARDPLQLTSQNLDAIILRLRQAHAQYKLGVKSAGNPKKTTKTPKTAAGAVDLVALGLLPSTTPVPTVKASVAEIDLSALGLTTPAGEKENGNAK